MDTQENTKKDFAGKNGFVWWIGTVEDRKDPLKMGRVRIRCVGWHSENKMQLPTEALPWAMPVLPPNNSNAYTPNEGDMVFGFFTDGEIAQDPVYLGSFPGLSLKESNPQQAFNDPRTDAELANAPREPQSKTYNTDGTGIEIVEKDKADRYPKIIDEPSTSRLARNDADSIDKTFIKERKDNVVKDVKTVNSTWSEPETKYGTVYPYNDVKETESGHIMEFDDTPGKERIQIAHRSGTFTEMYPDGDKVEKITKDNYTIVMKDNHVYIMGKCYVTIQGDAELYVQGDFDMKVDGKCTVESGGNMKFVAPRIDLNP